MGETKFETLFSKADKVIHFIKEDLLISEKAKKFFICTFSFDFVKELGFGNTTQVFGLFDNGEIDSL